MSLEELFNRYGLGTILLEGKRTVQPDDEAKLIALGKLLAEKLRHAIFRSGNAGGADELFCAGVAAVDASRLQVITPYTSHRKNKNLAGETISLDDIDLSSEPDVISRTKMYSKNVGLIDEYVAGQRHRNARKAAYLIRDTIKVIGTKESPAASFGIFYDDLEKPMAGGTGHTMRICQANNVPFVDQRVWIGWVI